MSTSLTSLAISFGILFVVVLFFAHERRRGKRYLDGLRTHVDFWLLKVRHWWNVGMRTWGRYFFRQIIHYFLHTFLTGIIASLTALVERLKSIARTNRTLAKKSDKERTEMNKLEAVALHKLEVALTEEEKRIRRKKSLEG